VITVETFWALVHRLGDQAADDISWSEALSEPSEPDEFALDVVFVICNSGMRNTVARGIYERCRHALQEGRPVAEVFGHRGKVGAIETVWQHRRELLQQYLALPSTQRLDFLEQLPWIGPITKYHLAKNFGLDCAKPDVHLQRLADREVCTAQQLCARLAAETGLRAATVDTVLWRACASGELDSLTGVLRSGDSAVV
jgi:hypothetical protein